MKVHILGAATTKFGELWDVSPRKLVRDAVDEALEGAGMKRTDIQGVFVGNMLASTLGGQQHVGALVAEELGLQCSAMKLEGACASGGLAMHSGVMAVASGMYETVLVVGVEKMTDHGPEEVARALMGAGSDGEREAGATFPGLYAMIARAHMAKYGTTLEQMAMVAVKNHYHASLNSHAHFTKAITFEQAMRSSTVASPLRLLDCSPISDGAAAVVLSSVKDKTSVEVAASVVATDTLGLARRDDITTLQATVKAAKKAYEIAGVNSDDIDVAEVHDCFTIAEIIAMEDLGFFPYGEAGLAVFAEKTKLGNGKLVVNTSGGLKASGHPVGATGVKQIVEIYRQLVGKAEKKQVEKARIGLTHNVGGSGATAVVHILKK